MTFTVPVLLNSVEMVEVAALPLLVNVPGLFTTAVAPVSLPPRGVADDVQSAARGLIVERRSVHDRQRAGTGSLAGIRVGAVQIDLDTSPRRRAGAAQLQRPTTIERKARRLNDAPPCAFVVPEPLCVPPEKFDDSPCPSPSACQCHSSSPPDCVSASRSHRAIEGRGATGDRHQSGADAAIDRRLRRR